MVKYFLVFICAASMASAETPYTRDGLPENSLFPENQGNVISWYGGASSARLEQSDNTGCPYYLDFHNANVHLGNNRDLTLLLNEGESDEISVSFSLIVRPHTADTLIITGILPEQYVAYPEEITVEEGETGRLEICLAMF